MDSTEIAVLVGGIFSIVFVLWFFFGAREEKTATKTPASGPIYACPMHPWITSDDAAANCSICGMKLVLQSEKTSQTTHHAAS